MRTHFTLFRGLAAAAMGTALLAACANKYEAVTPEIQARMMDDLKSGKPTLDCGAKCDFTWIAQAPQIHALDMAEKWDDLAVRVQQIGYGSDLAYYYMGQAAQGLGYHQAAITYYGMSLALATGQDPLLRCESGQSDNNDPCQGVDIVSSIPVLVQASRDALAQQAAESPAAAPVHHHHRRPKPPASGTATGSSGWAVPPAPGAAQSGGPAGWSAPPPATPSQ